MIVFDLRCADAGHVFEAWFGSGDDYERQNARGFVACPICGSPRIAKAAMAPRIGANAGTPAQPATNTLPVASGPEPAQMKMLLAKLATAQAEMLAKSEHVGKRFAQEARAIHAGESDERPIHGEATLGDARALVEEGIEVAPLPLPVRDPRAEN